MKKIVLSLLMWSSLCFGAVFEESFEKTISFEGDRYIHQKLPNGRIERSKYGVTQETLDMFNTKNDADLLAKTLTKEKARIVYYDLFWAKLNLYEIKEQDLANAIFDYHVHSGTWAISRLQLATNKELKRHGYSVRLSVDGIMGEQTIKWANEMRRINGRSFTKKYNNERLYFLRTYTKGLWKKYQRGFTRRVNSFN